MHALHGSWSAARWRPPALMLALVICHATVFYALAHTRVRAYALDTISGGESLFGAVIAAVWQPPRQGLLARWEPPEEAPLIVPPSHWRFPPIDLWPSPPGWSAVPSGFTPVTDAQADPPQAPAAAVQRPGHAVPARQSHLRMILWLRPVYGAGWARGGSVSRIVLDLRIDPQGHPVDVMVVQTSGSPSLDESALQAAPGWRFAWPPSKSPPDVMWARIELRFNGLQQ